MKVYWFWSPYGDLNKELLLEISKDCALDSNLLD
jgi:hypothetical protein